MQRISRVTPVSYYTAYRDRCPVVIALNMTDLLEKRGIKIDTNRLSMLLDCPIVETSALKQTGLDTLIETSQIKVANKRS